ncbi:hypothetical protein AAFF_G00221020 [Aldrovandia affinis]|uniref:Uncharacterized protein n=1 Tax=Aldrovandia affinis TaxID=143900 RepID=A0AAD7RG12_9TELE|nr:hypothetical protein AAFF_G00221020 [Aldrovandia affinis]
MSNVPLRRIVFALWPRLDSTLPPRGFPSPSCPARPKPLPPTGTIAPCPCSDWSVWGHGSVPIGWRGRRGERARDPISPRVGVDSGIPAEVKVSLRGESGLRRSPQETEPPAQASHNGGSRGIGLPEVLRNPRHSRDFEVTQCFDTFLLNRGL